MFKNVISSELKVMLRNLFSSCYHMKQDMLQNLNKMKQIYVSGYLKLIYLSINLMLAAWLVRLHSLVIAAWDLSNCSSLYFK